MIIWMYYENVLHATTACMYAIQLRHIYNINCIDKNILNIEFDNQILASSLYSNMSVY